MIILGIIILVLVFASIVLVVALVNEKDYVATLTRSHQIERENLIEKHTKDREYLAKQYEADREKLTDKLLVRNGVSPIYTEREPPKPHTIESTLNRNARLKKESEDRPTIGVKNANN